MDIWHKDPTQIKNWIWKKKMLKNKIGKIFPEVNLLNCILKVQCLGEKQLKWNHQQWDTSWNSRMKEIIIQVYRLKSKSPKSHTHTHTYTHTQENIRLISEFSTTTFTAGKSWIMLKKKTDSERSVEGRWDSITKNFRSN